MKKILAIFCTLMMVFTMIVMPAHAKSTSGNVVASSSVIKENKTVSRKGVRALSTNSTKLYNYLYKAITKIDNGTTTSTTITIPMSAFGMNKTVTKKQLGVSKLTSNGVVPNSVNAKLLSYLKIDFSAVINKLYYQVPEMYWYDYYDARWTLSSASNYNVAFYVTSHSIRYYTKSGSIQIKMAVGKEYGSHYKISSNGQRLFALAKDNAKRIVSAASGLSDYNKLMYYKNVLSEITDYDEGAMTNYKKSYIAQWELVNALDGNAKTKVVCEGYAKAYQYLCDLTSFENTDTYSEMVSGEVKATGQDSYEHMWNLVHFNGANYIVDVTNCDDDDGNVATDRTFMIGNSSTSSTSYTIPVAYGTSSINVTYTYDNTTLACYNLSDLKLASANYTSTEVLSSPEVHIYNIGTTTKKATLTSTGTAVQTCMLCGATRTVTLSKLKIGTPSIKKAVYKRSRKISVTLTKGAYNTSYQISYRVKGSSKWTSVSTKSLSKTLSKLKRKKYYYVRVRGISGSVKSSWSSSKLVYVRS